MEQLEQSSRSWNL